MATSQPNPWINLPLAPDYVLPDDERRVREFNRSAKPHTRLELQLIPEPFLGEPAAPLVLLNLNPGLDPRDFEHHRKQKFIDRSRENLLHRESRYPFFLLDPGIAAPGHFWWKRRLRALIERFDLERIAQRVLCVEYFPYHSERFRHCRPPLPSQSYSFWLVQSALSRNVLVVVLRSRRIWFEAVPDLANYSRIYMLRNPQSPSISPRNCPDGFEAICDAIQSP